MATACNPFPFPDHRADSSTQIRATCLHVYIIPDVLVDGRPHWYMIRQAEFPEYHKYAINLTRTQTHTHTNVGRMHTNDTRHGRTYTYSECMYDAIQSQSFKCINMTRNSTTAAAAATGARHHFIAHAQHTMPPLFLLYAMLLLGDETAARVFVCTGKSYSK